MKAFMYISRAVNEGAAPWMPFEYTSILNASRKGNEERGLTGFLSYQNGYFIHYIEGEAEQLDPLMLKVLKDPRHMDMQVLINRDINGRNFSKWRMPIGNRLAASEEYSLFTEHFQASFQGLTQTQTEILNQFGIYKSLSKKTQFISSIAATRLVKKTRPELKQAF